MTGSGVQGNWMASSVKEKDIMKLREGWTKKVEEINCPPPLSKDPAIPLVDDTAPDTDSSSECRPRDKPLAESPAHDSPQRSLSSGGSLDPTAMDSGSLLGASYPKSTDDAEVLSQRDILGQGETQEAVEVAPEVVERVQSVKNGLAEACTSLLTCFEASLLAATSQGAEVSELKQSLERAKEELGCVKKQQEEKQGAATEVENLKAALAEAQKRAAEEESVREKHEARVGEVQQELEDAVKKCESLERKIADQESELAKAHPFTHEARVEVQGTLQEIQEAKKITEGAATEVETLKAALAEAQKRAAEEESVREKHEARVGEVQQELEDAVKKCESLERKIADQESELAKAHPCTQEARVEA
nr:plectin-like [Aegilops tauschii subsp. strangulata]